MPINGPCNGGGDQPVYQLAATGTYTIVIEDQSLANTGNYNVTLLQIPRHWRSISSGQTLSESIAVASAMEVSGSPE